MNGPVVYVDPEGEFGFIGAALGMGFELVIQAADSYLSGENRFDARDVLISGIAGFAGANLGNMISKAKSLGKVTKEATSLLSDMTVTTASEYAKNGEINPVNVVGSVGLGKLGQNYVGRLNKSIASNNHIAKSYDKAINRANRMSQPNKRNGSPRKIGRLNSRQDKLNSLQQGKSNYLNEQELKGGIIGTSSGGAVFGTSQKVVENNEQ